MPRLTEGCRRRPALIRADSTVELNTETCIYMYLPLIINPGNTEHNLSFPD